MGSWRPSNQPRNAGPVPETASAHPQPAGTRAASARASITLASSGWGRTPPGRGHRRPGGVRDRRSSPGAGTARGRSPRARPRVAEVRSTATWALSTLPAGPVYRRCPPTVWLPFLRSPVSSTTSTAAGVAEVLDQPGADVVADRVVVPDRPGQPVLQAVGGGLAGVLSDRPAVPARQVGQQPAHERAGGPSRLHPPEPVCDPAQQLLQPRLPAGRGYAVACGHRVSSVVHIPPDHHRRPPWLPARSPSPSRPDQQDHELRLEYQAVRAARMVVASTPAAWVESRRPAFTSSAAACMRL
jgi:hypothetical protein